MAATGIGKNYYLNVIEDQKKMIAGEVKSFSSPGKTRKRESPKSTLTEGQIETIRSTIHNYAIIEKRHPTCKYQY